MTRLEDVLMEKRAYENFRDWDIWGASSVSGDARTNWMDPGRGGILRRGLLMDSINWER